jgi:deazaflavin-dependent oxidoreductase (nitroreductase family)
MVENGYSRLGSLARRLAASGFGRWLGIRLLHHLDRFVYFLTNGQTTFSKVTTGLPEVMLETVGARSGQPRTTPLACIQDKANPDVFAVIASNWGQNHHPGWYYNLKANPRVHCSFGVQTGEYIAHEATGDEYAKFWGFAVETYYGFELYRHRAGDRRIPIMVLTPVK